MTKAMFSVCFALLTFGLFAQHADVAPSAKAGKIVKEQVALDPTTSCLPGGTSSHQLTSGFTPINLRGNIAQAMHLYPTQQHDSWDVDAPGTPTVASAFTINMRGGEYFNGVWYCYDDEAAGYNFYQVNPETGAIISQTANAVTAAFQDMAYNYANNTMYGTSSNSLCTIDLTTGAATPVATLSAPNTIMTLAIDLAGNAYGIEISSGDFYSIDLTTGTCTLVGPTGKAVSYVQSMGFDHYTGTLYWGQCSAVEDMNFCSVDATTGTATVIAAGFGEIMGFFVPYVANQNIAAAPTNFTATPDPDQGLSCELSWTNPSTTLGGDPLTSITKMVLKRGSDIIQELTTATPGQAMTFTDNVPTAGSYSYSVYAVTSEGNGLSAGANAIVGPMCSFTVFGSETYGDGWNGAAINFVGTDGTTYASFTFSSGNSATAEYILPSGLMLNCVWVAGSYDGEVNGITITDQNGSVIFEAAAAPAAGTFFTFTNNCSQDVPSPPTNLVVTPDPDNGLSATLTWTNPSATLNGGALTMTSATVMRNGEVVYTINNPVNGANETYVDNVPVAANYTYMVYVTNEAGNSGSVSATVGVGGIYQMVLGQTVEITTCSGIIYDNGGSAGDYANNSDDIMIIHPATAGSSVAIAGTYVIETNYDKLYVYDGAGIEGALLNTYTLTSGGNIEDVSSSGPLTLHFTSDNSVQKSGFEISINCVSQTSISGNVTNLATGAPIAGATVTFSGVGIATATTDANGNYTTNILSGIFNITVAAQGYNTITETGFEIPTTGVTGKNFVMTAPTIAVTPAAVTINAPFEGEGTATVTITNNGNGPLNFASAPIYAEDVTREPWDLIHSFSLTHAGMQGIATDGQFIYTASWQAAPAAGNVFQKYTLEGEFVEGFDIAGVTGVRDLTYDGTYFYCGAGTATLYCLDLVNHTLVSQITTSATIRHCSYDPANDGFWIGNWEDLYLVDRTGATLDMGPSLSSVQAYGSGYDNVTEGGPYLLFFGQPASDAKVFQYNIATQAINQIFDFASTPGYNAGISGGAFVGEYNGKICFFGNAQQDPNLIGIYELGTAGWLSMSPSSGTIAAGQSQTVTLTGTAGEMDPGTYYATATFTSKNPNVGEEDVAVTFIIGEAACGKPQNVQAVADAEAMEVDVTWNAVDDATSYKVYMGTTVVGTVTTNAFTYTDVEYETEYCFKVSAVCPAGEGPKSDEDCSEEIPEPQICNAPTNLVAEAGETVINLTWNAPARRDDVLLEEGFESGIPSTWTLIDNDGDGNNWTADDGTMGGVGHGGTGLVTSASYDNNTGVLYPDNFLITPMVEGAGSVKYWVSAQDASYAYEKYAVCASTTGTAASDFTVVFEETMVAKGDKYAGTRGSKAQGTWYERTVDLPAGTKYVAFRHYDCSDAFRLNLDDVTVYGGGAPAILLYNVYRDEVKIASNVEGESYSDDDIQLNVEYCYTVTHVCTFGESDHSNEDCEIVSSSINEVNSAYQIFPNPANAKVTVKGENVASIAVYNVLGQMVDNIKVTNSTSKDINTAAYESGVYMLRITTTDGTIVSKRVVVTH